MANTLFRLRGGVAVLAGLVAGSIAIVPVWAQSQALTIVVTDEPQSLDPCDTDLSNNSRVLRNNVTETLVNLDPANGDVTPSLATEWTKTGDNTWTFKLRSGVTFHDGAPFNAAAAATAIERIQQAALACNTLASDLVGNHYEAKAVDDLTLEVTSDQPDPILPNKMSVIDIASPATPMAAKTREPIGTGPYRFVAWNAGQSVTLGAYDGYWGDKPAIHDVNIVWRSESAVRAAMVDTGEAQIAYEISPQDATTPNDKTYINAETSLLRIDTLTPPLDDVRVRKAINLAIDRDGMIGSVFHKDAQKAMQIVVPSVFGYNPDIPVWTYDPEQAKTLIAEAKAAGTPVDKEIVLYGRIGLYPNGSESLEAIQAMLMDVGLNVKLEMLETNPWVDQLLAPFEDNRPPTLLQTQTDNTQGDAVFTLAPRFRSDGQQAMLHDANLDALIDKATAASGEERRKAFQEAYRIIAVDDVAFVPLFHMVSSVRVSPSVSYVPDVQAGNEIKLRTISFK